MKKVLLALALTAFALPSMAETYECLDGQTDALHGKRLTAKGEIKSSNDHLPDGLGYTVCTNGKELIAKLQGWNPEQCYIAQTKQSKLITCMEKTKFALTVETLTVWKTAKKKHNVTYTRLITGGSKYDSVLQLSGYAGNPTKRQMKF